MAAQLFGVIQRQIFHQQWTGTDQAHVTFNHIPKLGQLIQTAGAKETAKGRHPLCIRQRVSLGIMGIAHGTELDHFEGLAVQPRPDLAKKHRGTESLANQVGNHRDHRRKDNEPCACGEDIETTF
ncbi:hypothetical protein D3C79_785550 [compost metagenome]